MIQGIHPKGYCRELNSDEVNFPNQRGKALYSNYLFEICLSDPIFQILLHHSSSIWVEKEPIYLFEDIINCDQSNTQTMECKDSIVYGRHNPPAQTKGVTETEYKRDNDFPSGSRLGGSLILARWKYK
ncbi:MAG: hypothetical protein EZS28_054002 [Streblomastix strix]|uniref:Uncharacterized protein n=1 Tax=Streblomastix strix TaxID=222440 RepID=A0A5J4QXL4_9EUKA|nr:MAG: hypothetical protein EZS28_054002 [Streblomastix strix]